MVFICSLTFLIVSPCLILQLTIALEVAGKTFDLNPPEIIVGAIVVLIIADVTGFFSNSEIMVDLKKDRLEKKNLSQKEQHTFIIIQNVQL